MEILRVNGITKVYAGDVLKRRLVVLDNLSVDFPLQKCTGLFGHNGAGKTTLIRLIFGLNRPTRGKITIGDADIKAIDKRRIGYMPEVDKTSNSLTPKEIISNHCKIFSLDDVVGRTKRVLAKVGLLASWNKKSMELSKGMGRRLSFAQSIVHEPHFLILDEPFSGLDPLGREDMHSWIMEQKAKDVTVILCSHELKEAYLLCDEFNILRKGKLVYSTMGSESRLDASVLLYAITMEEMTMESFQPYQSESGLQAPLFLEPQAEGGLVARFDDYQLASQWLTFLFAKGVKISMFSDNKQEKIEREMLKFFDLGEHVA